MSTTDSQLSSDIESQIVRSFTSKYGSEITDSEILQYNDEVQHEPTIPDVDIPDASTPITDAAMAEFYKDDGLIDSGFPSNIPRKIDKLYKFRNMVMPSSTTEVTSVLLLSNKLTEDTEITGGYNAICVDLDTCGHVLTIDNGSTLAAL